MSAFSEFKNEVDEMNWRMNWLDRLSENWMVRAGNKLYGAMHFLKWCLIIYGYFRRYAILSCYYHSGDVFVDWLSLFLVWIAIFCTIMPTKFLEFCSKNGIPGSRDHVMSYVLKH